MLAEIQALDGILQTWITKTIKPELSDFARMQFGERTGKIPSILDPHYPHHFRTAIARIWVLIMAIAVLLFFLAFVVASFAVSITVIVEMIKNPSLPEPWSTCVVAYVLLGYLVSLLFLCFRWIPLPYRDYTLVLELSELAKTDRKAYEEKLRQIIRR
jgi:hypothetical protein